MSLLDVVAASRRKVVGERSLLRDAATTDALAVRHLKCYGTVVRLTTDFRTEQDEPSGFHISNMARDGGRLSRRRTRKGSGHARRPEARGRELRSSPVLAFLKTQPGFRTFRGKLDDMLPNPPVVLNGFARLEHLVVESGDGGGHVPRFAFLVFPRDDILDPVPTMVGPVESADDMGRRVGKGAGKPEFFFPIFWEPDDSIRYKIVDLPEPLLVSDWHEIRSGSFDAGQNFTRRKAQIAFRLSLQVRFGAMPVPVLAGARETNHAEQNDPPGFHISNMARDGGRLSRRRLGTHSTTGAAGFAAGGTQTGKSASGGGGEAVPGLA